MSLSSASHIKPRDIVQIPNSEFHFCTANSFAFRAHSDELRILRDVRILRADADRNNFILGEKIDRCRADAIAYSMDSAVRLGKRITVVDLTLQNNVSVIGMLKIEQGKTKDAISDLAKDVRGLNSKIDGNRAEAVNLSSTVDQGFVGVEKALRSNGSAINSLEKGQQMMMKQMEKGQQMMMKQMERSEKGQQMMMKQMTMMMKQMKQMNSQ